MTYDYIYTKVVEIIKDILDDDSIKLSKTSSQDNTDGWDSLTNINIISTIQEELNVKFSFNEILEIKTIDDIVNKSLEKLS